MKIKKLTTKEEKSIIHMKVDSIITTGQIIPSKNQFNKNHVLNTT